MTQENWLSTSPFEPPTHWKQVVFPIIAGQIFSEGATISGNVTCKPISTNYRGLDLAFDFANLGEGRPCNSTTYFNEPTEEIGMTE
jgi:hypothetical protein